MLDAAKAMKLSAKDLLELQIIEEVIPEPLGGAHRDKNLILDNVRISIKKNLEIFKTMSPEDIFNQRKNKFLKVGRNKGFIENLEDLSSLKIKTVNLNKILKYKRFFITSIIFVLICSMFYLFLL